MSAQQFRTWVGVWGKGRIAIAIVMAVITVVASFAVTTRLRLDPNVASLLPERGEAAALRRYLRAFGGSDLGMVLVRGDDPVVVEEGARALAEQLSALDVVQVATDRIDTKGRSLDPMLAWRHADAAGRARLASALTPEGMRKRLKGSRAMLLAPGGGAASETIARDPLRLAQLIHEGGNIGSGWRTEADGSFTTADGRARVVLVRPQGQALRGDDAKAFVRAAETVIGEQRSRYPSLEIGITGGHAIAAATEKMLRRDLTVSGSLSFLLAALAFALTFRRLRALLAVMPPLLLGTLWTAGIAAAMPSGLSAIAVAFMSVVVGVGVDTGVHVYAALLEARQEGLDPAAAARRARQQTMRPVLVAAVTAGAAFASLALSEIGALVQLGILCAGGEILTALAIVVVTPEIGARLERTPPPAYRKPRWTDGVTWLSGTRRRAALVSVVALVPVFALLAGYAPSPSDAIVAVRPAGLEPLEVQDRVYQSFGGRRGQWVVMVADRQLDDARERADRIAERLATMGDDIESVDAITALVPAPSTQRARFADRDALDMPSKADALERALQDTGFAPARFEQALAAMRSASNPTLTLDTLEKGGGPIMLSRYLGRDGDEHMVVVYSLVRRDADAEARVEQAIREVDPKAMITGYTRLDRALHASLRSDMPRIGAVAGMLVLLALALALRRPRDVALAAAVVVAEIGAVLVLVRIFDVPLHAYDALVLPVLLGITVDEGMFLLYRARATSEGDPIRETLRLEGPPVATTALTTAAGFGGLIMCDFDGLRHLGMVGALGSLSGLVVALIIVPAGLRVAGTRSSQAPTVARESG
jgi:predicted RND superfamily exporter protein